MNFLVSQISTVKIIRPHTLKFGLLQILVRISSTKIILQFKNNNIELHIYTRKKTGVSWKLVEKNSVLSPIYKRIKIKFRSALSCFRKISRGLHQQNAINTDCWFAEWGRKISPSTKQETFPFYPLKNITNPLSYHPVHVIFRFPLLPLL